VIHAHFQHGGAAIGREAQDGKRHADVVVEIANGLADGQGLAKKVRDGVFGGGFAGAASDGDDGSGPAIARPGGEMLEGAEGVGD
jgi:hypothetical protein